MIHVKRLLSFLFILIFSCVHAQESSSDTLRILFIGNSYTYYNSTPELLKAFIAEQSPGQAVETQLISEGGMTLARHWQEESTLQTIRNGDWDFVVLQEQSKLGMGVIIDDRTYLGPTEQFFEHARKFDGEIKKAGARTVFLMTWSERDRPEDQAILTHAYTTIAKELNAIVAPLGLVWNEVRTHPDIDLYDNDGTHPSPMGSYLYAATLYATLFSNNPEGVSGTISGYRLSNRGEPSADRQVLVNIPDIKAQYLQQASWDIVKSITASADFLNAEAPQPGYTIPVLPDGEAFDLKDISGRWYGTGTYGFNYLGQIMDIEEVEGAPVVRLSFYSPNTQDLIRVERAKITGDRLTMDLYDTIRERSSILQISVKDDTMKGLIVSPGAVSRYNHINFSRAHVHKGIDLAAMNLLMGSFKANAAKAGYVKAAIQYYEQYSEMIGQKYIPEEFYLNAEGYNLLEEERMEAALNRFELAIHYYPQSVNAYESYAEALVMAGRSEEAIAVYTRAYELGKKSGYEHLPRIETNLNKLRNNILITPSMQALPPPPPPPPGQQ